MSDEIIQPKDYYSSFLFDATRQDMVVMHQVKNIFLVIRQK